MEEESEHSPNRRCLVTSSVKPKEECLRFVLSPDGVVTPDLEGKLPGRGFWLSADKDVLKIAMQKGHFAKAAKTRVTFPSDLDARVELLLKRRCLNFLGLAKRAGVLLSGFMKVKEAMTLKKVMVLLEAKDGAAGGKEKLSLSGLKIGRIEDFSRAELAESLGLDDVVHVGLLPGGASRKFMAELERWRKFRGETGRIED